MCPCQLLSAGISDGRFSPVGTGCLDSDEKCEEGI